MKLCPQCAFIYEDDQEFCDMDGQELVHDQASRVVDQTALPKSNTNLPSRARRKLVPALLTGAVILAALLSVIYLAQRQPSQGGAAVAIPIQSLPQANAIGPNPQTSSANSISNSRTDASLAVESAYASSSPAGPVQLADASITKAPAMRATEVSAHAIAAAPAVNQSSPVIVRLMNGASIKADDGGETKTSFWYRQGGMVTFIKRSQVRAIERRRSSSSPSNLSADNKNEKMASARPTGGQNQLRLQRLPPATVKRESRVTLFLKKTGQIIGKPFKR
jgi:hypothetical protein